MKAIWNDATLAESDMTIVIEGNHNFPPETVNLVYFRMSSTHTVCHWKGLASYYDVVVGEKVNRDAAWFYSEPSDAAKKIKNFVAFWHEVKIVE